MAYQSSTVGSTASNPPVLLTMGALASTGIGSTVASTSGRGPMPRLWGYNSTHLQTDLDDAGFVTDARLMGMQLGDCILVIGSTTLTCSFHIVQSLSSTGATLSAGLLVSSAS